MILLVYYLHRTCAKPTQIMSSHIMCVTLNSSTTAHHHQVLKDCEMKQKRGDSNYPTLAHAVNHRLRDAVGETHWAMARKIRACLKFERGQRQSKEHQQERKQKKNSFNKSPSLRTVREEEEEDDYFDI